MKKLCTLMLVFTLLLCNLSFVQASSDTLTDEQKQEVIEYGFPEDYPSSIQKFYDDFVELVDYPSYGSYTSAYDAFLIFVSNMKYESSASNVEDFSIVARGLYSEVSNHYGTMNQEIYAIADCMTNRVESGKSYWSTYLEACQYQGMNCINPNYESEYWQGDPVKNPLEDAARTSEEAREALIIGYMIAWDKVGVMSTPSDMKYWGLDSAYLYFDKAEVDPDEDEQVGQFYFHKSN